MKDEEYVNHLEEKHKQMLEDSRQWVRYQMQQLEDDPEYQVQGVFSEAFLLYKKGMK